MKNLANTWYFVLISLSMACILSACNGQANNTRVEKINADSILKAETKQVLNALIATHIKPEFFSLNAKPLKNITINQYRLKDSLHHIDSAFCDIVVKKIEAGPVNDNTFRWTEELVPKAIIVDFEMHKTHPLFNKKLLAMAGDGLYYISQPVFNEAYDLALIDYSFSSFKRCGVGSLILYKKVNGQWKQYKILSSWVS